MSIKYIYKATNKINGKGYIGQTINFCSRKKQHIYSSKHKLHNYYFHRAIRKYSKENFEWEIVFEGECHQNKLNSLEIFFIAYYNTKAPNGYNLTDGGEGVVGLSKEKRKEAARKLSITRKKLGLAKGQKNPGSSYNMSRKERIEKSIKASNTKKQLNKESGLTGYEEISLKMKEVLSKIDPETGLSIAKKRGIKGGKTLREMGIVKGHKNPNAKKYLLISPNGQLIGSWGNLEEICKKYNLSYGKIKSHINKGIISKPYKSHKNMIKVTNCVGWEIIEL